MDWLITLAYIVVPLWKMFSLWKLDAWRWDTFGIVLHLILVAMRRTLHQLGYDAPATWATVHGLTITLAMLGAFIEAWRWRRGGRLMDRRFFHA